MAALPTKTVDNRGRLTLGNEFAGQQFFIHRAQDNTIQLIPAETVPAREAWLYRNPAALSAVMEGLQQAQEGTFADGPDIDQLTALAEELED